MALPRGERSEPCFGPLSNRGTHTRAERAWVPHRPCFVSDRSRTGHAPAAKGGSRAWQGFRFEDSNKEPTRSYGRNQTINTCPGSPENRGKPVRGKGLTIGPCKHCSALAMVPETMSKAAKRAVVACLTRALPKDAQHFGAIINIVLASISLRWGFRWSKTQRAKRAPSPCFAPDGPGNNERSREASGGCLSDARPRCHYVPAHAPAQWSPQWAQCSASDRPRGDVGAARRRRDVGAASLIVSGTKTTTGVQDYACRD